MSDDFLKELKEQRDRYVSFAFAGGDLFIEVSEQGKILHATGAAKSLTGIDDKSLAGRNWLDLFSAYEISKLQRAYEDTIPGRRIGPFMVTLNEQIGQKIASFSAIRMPKNNRFYIMLGVSNEFIARIAPMVGLPGMSGFTDNFADAARDAVFDAHLWGKDVAMTFFDFMSADEMQARFGKDGWGKVEQMIGEIMAQYSFGGYSAGQIAEGRYAFMHDTNLDLNEVKQKILDIAAAQGIDLGELQTKSITGDLKTMDKTELSRAVEHTIQEYASQGPALQIETFEAGHKNYLSMNASKLKEFKTIIERVSFAQHFYPVAALKTRELLHYEILPRFENGDAEEWLHFGEDAGLAPDFDLAACARAIQYIRFKSGGTRVKFVTNMSPRSVIDKAFTEKLKEQLTAEKSINERLQFQIADSCNIGDIAKTGRFIRDLQDSGFKVTLGDFRPGASTVNYIQGLKADYIRLNGKFIRTAQSTPREEALLREIVRLCGETGCEIIASGVDHQNTASFLTGLDIKYGQGAFFAPPGPKPDYIAKPS
jgi:PAS domain S-box-containing protein